jgi:hypothetical protein
VGINPTGQSPQRHKYADLGIAYAKLCEASARRRDREGSAAFSLVNILSRRSRRRDGCSVEYARNEGKEVGAGPRE